MKSILKKLAKVFGLLLVLLIILLLTWYHPDLSASKAEDLFSTAESSFIQVDDARVHIRKRGAGPIILLLHGSFASLHTWADWEDSLQHHFTTLSVDLPGHGLSGPRPSARYSVDDYRELMIALLDSMKIEKVIAIGNSMGGAVAWKMALNNPERVSKLILVDPAGYQRPVSTTDTIGTKRPWVFSLLSSPFFGRMMQSFTPKFLFKSNLKQVYANTDNIKEGTLERYFQLMLRDGNRKATIQRIGQASKPQFHELNKLKQPTLLLWGIKDRWIPVEQAYAFKEQIPHAEMVVFPNAGHVPMEEIPQQSVKEVFRFLQ